MTRRLSCEEMDEIHAQNEAIMDSLERDLKIITHGLSRIIELYDSGEAGVCPKQLYESMKAIVERGLDNVAHIIPEDLGRFKRMLDDYSSQIDVVDAIMAENLSGIGEDLKASNSIKQYVKDYLYGICTIFETFPGANDDEILDDMDVLSHSLREALLLRAGCVCEDFEDDCLCGQLQLGSSTTS